MELFCRITLGGEGTKPPQKNSLMKKAGLDGDNAEEMRVRGLEQTRLLGIGAITALC